MDTLREFSIPLKGIKAGEHQFEFQLNKEFLEALQDDQMIDADVVATVTMTKAAAMITFEVELNGTACVECDRCLDEIEYPIEAEDTLYVKFSEEEYEFDGEVMWLNPAEEQINLAEYLYETLLLALPYQRVHDNIEDCNPEMISRFSIVSEEEFEQIAEPKEASLAAGESGQMLAALKRSMEESAEEEN